MALLELKKLRESLWRTPGRDDVTFQVEKGEISASSGPNGSGKTTIFNCINHFYPITAAYVLSTVKALRPQDPQDLPPGDRPHLPGRETPCANDGA